MTLSMVAGNDTMFGGAGNDVYYVDTLGDVVFEDSNAGTDEVRSSISWMLDVNVENLRLIGTAAINGAGNGLNNQMWGNNAANRLSGFGGADYLLGADGNDTLDGGNGDDILDGGLGDDTYFLQIGGGKDIIKEDSLAPGNNDLLSIGAGVQVNQLWFSKVGSDLKVSILGTTDNVTIVGWYATANAHVEQFRTTANTGTGVPSKLLRDSGVDALVQSMAAFSSPPASAIPSTPEYAAVNAAIAANWQ